MSLDSLERCGWSRRAWLRCAAGAALSPLIARAGCPCGPDEKDAQVAAAATQPTNVLRVCADPNNLPFSNRAHEGFEDRIAALIAADLGMTLEYRWLPQRLGFYREALKTGDSNLVMAAPGGFEKAMTSDPYYRSSYVFVYRKDGTAYRSLDDPALRSAKIGVPLTGGDNTPPTHALARRKLIDNVTGFPVFDESEGRPGERLIAAVASGEIDVAIAWGPAAGYFAKHQAVPLEVVPVSPEEDAEGDAVLSFAFDICMALRRPDKELKGRINQAIQRRRAEIDKILDDYGVPHLPLREKRVSAERDLPAESEHKQEKPRK